MELLILLGGALMIGAGVAACTPPIWVWLLGRVAVFEARTQVALTELFVLDLTPRTVTWVVTGLILLYLVPLLLANVLFPGLPLGYSFAALLVLAAKLLLIWFIFGQLVKRRRGKLDMQLMDGLITIANGVRSGMNLVQAMQLVERHAAKPLSQEFGLLLREVEHGTSVDVALENASRRIKSHNFHLLFAALKTTRLRGGNIPQTLDRLGESLREIVRLEEKVKAQTAQGRMSAFFMGAMPVAVLLIYSVIDPYGVKLLFTETSGQAILAVVLFLNILGFMWIRRIVMFEI